MILELCIAFCLNYYSEHCEQIDMARCYSRLDRVAIELPQNCNEIAIYNHDALDLLAMVVQAEAGNQDLLGKRLVVDVILNRVDSEKFPNDLESVLRQSGQFSVVASGAIYRNTPSDETIEAIQMELENRTDTEIMFFCAGGYNSCCEPAYQYGDHYFGYLKGSK